MKYVVTGTVTVSCWCEVEAESEEAAMEIAKGLQLAEHHIDGSSEVTECWHFDNDGTPQATSLESED